MAGCEPFFYLKNSNDRQWYIFIAISVAVYFIGLFAILIGRHLNHKLIKPRRKIDDDDGAGLEKGWYIQLKEFAGSLEAGQNFPGKLLIVMSFGSNVVAFGIYIYYTKDINDKSCNHELPHPWIGAGEYFLYICFLLHYLLKFIIATDKLTFWVYNTYTYIEILTVPTVLTQQFLDSGWIGLRFLRVIYIRKLSEILVFLNILSVGSSLQLSNIIGKFIALLLSTAGAIHLCENTGDFWGPIYYTNATPRSYFDCVYFVVVTFSTVGYGDISCKTYLGRVCSMIAIVIGLGSFASCIPAIFDFLSSHTKYNRNFKVTPGKKHVIVTGHITDKSVASFIQDFLHPDRQCESSVTIVFLSPEPPSLVIQSILQKHCTSVFYFIGTVYKFKDCKRVMMEAAEAVIVLCDKKCKNPEAEDAENITRVISMKKYFRKTHIRCIVQLMRKESKANLKHFQLWNEEDHGDAIVCTDELKLGFMAQSCNAPGFSSLLANLFVMRKNDSPPEGENAEDWKKWYLHGVSCEIYSTKLSDYFIGMSFQRAAQICFEKLKLLLIAVELKTGRGRYFAINPKDDVKIVKDTTAFIIAQDSKSVSNAQRFCGDCHSTIAVPRKRIRSCRCAKSSHQNEIYRETHVNLSSFHASPYTCHIENFANKAQKVRAERKTSKENATVLSGVALELTKYIKDKKMREISEEEMGEEREETMFDETGTYVWCAPRLFHDATISVEEAESKNFQSHVVVLVVSDVTSPSLGLRELIQPLRASNQPVNKMMKIVLLGDEEFLAKEWKSISTFPDVYVVKGSPYRQLNLYAINVHLAEMCILLSPCQGSENVGCEEEAMSDKEVIMVTLNLRAMKFDYQVDENVKLAEKQRSLRRRSARIQDNFFSIDFRHLEKTSKTNSSNNKNDFAEVAIRRISGEAIRMMTELVYDANTLYLDDDENVMEMYASDGIWMTQSYACGSVFSDSVLDFLASATYFNRDILTLVRNLVTGSVNPVLDEILSHGRQPVGTKETPMIAAMRNRCRIEQLSLADPVFSNREEEVTKFVNFGELFLNALKSHGALCLGLYRLHQFRCISNKSLNKRYVINFPPKDFNLMDTDLVFVLLQFDTTNQYQTSAI